MEPQNATFGRLASFVVNALLADQTFMILVRPSEPLRKLEMSPMTS